MVENGSTDGSRALHLMARGPHEFSAILERIEQVASLIGDEYHQVLARWQRFVPGTSVIVRDLARERGDRYVEAWATMRLASDLADDEPNAAAPEVQQAQAVAVASGNPDLRNAALVAQATLARSLGDLTQCIQLAGVVVEIGFWSNPGASQLGFAALLARDEDALRRVVDAGNHAQRKTPGTATWVETARHRQRLLQGQPPMVDPDLRDPSDGPPTKSTGWLWLAGREALDAGAADVAVAGVRALSRPGPHGQAVLAALEAAATGDEDRWHDALTIALDQGLRLIAVDALEGLGVAACRAESWAEGSRLLAAAERLRDETGYRWRFGFEQHAVDAARAAALETSGNDALGAADAEGRKLDWREAADYVRRTRGQRKRPRHGWASLTPTEHHVVRLVAEGLTNPQVAEQLFISRATVKTHLEHIFVKLGVRSRAELAAQTARRADT